MISRVVVHLRKGIYYVESYDRTMKKVWLAGGTPVAIPEHQPGALGQAVRDVMDHCELDVTRSVRSNLTGPLLRLAGVASYATYTKGLRTVGVNATDETGDLIVTVTPTFKDSEGYAQYDADAAQTFIYDSPGQLQVALLKAFEATTPT